MTRSAAAGRAVPPTASRADLAGWLGLAAAPTFALMAWISAIGSPGTMLCSAASAFLPINDMTLMYLLMGLFHLSPWLRLHSARLQRDTSTTKPEGN